MGPLEIKNFAQIGKVSLDFGDLTVLVGAQGTGKSLALEWLKFVLDGRHVVNALRDAGHIINKDSTTIIDLLFGSGMGAAWGENSKLSFEGKGILPHNISRRGSETEKLFYIPAQRSMLISDGWAAPFQKLGADAPVVARIFSQHLFDRFSGKGSGRLFPQMGVLKKVYRKQIDEAIFHGGTVALEQDQQHARRLRLTHGDSQLPFMSWTAGQREFTPLLLGLYHLLPASQKFKQDDIDWVIIEEPEMGLHPQAVSVVLLLVLELLWRGYRVVISSHSPDLLTGVWMLRKLVTYSQHKNTWKHLCRAFGIKPSATFSTVAQAALQKEFKVHHLAFAADGLTYSSDISSLDPDDENDAISGWGGLIEFSSRFGDAVAAAVNEYGDDDEYDA